MAQKSAVAFVLDVTTSMSNAIEAVKATVSDCLTLLKGKRDLEFVVVTFTEDSQGSYVSVLRECDAGRLAQRVRGLRVGSDPDTGRSACGDDGSENAKHALAVTHETLKGVPTVAFLVTDNKPHFAQERSKSETHKQEDRCLAKMGRPHDAYRLLSSICQPFEKGEDGAAPLVLVPVINLNCGFYHEMARRTGGMVLCLDSVGSMKHAWASIVRFFAATVRNDAEGEAGMALAAAVKGIADLVADEPPRFVAGRLQEAERSAEAACAMASRRRSRKLHEPEAASDAFDPDIDAIDARSASELAADSALEMFMENLRLEFSRGRVNLDERDLESISED